MHVLPPEVGRDVPVDQGRVDVVSPGDTLSGAAVGVPSCCSGSLEVALSGEPDGRVGGHWGKGRVGVEVGGYRAEVLFCAAGSDRVVHVDLVLPAHRVAAGDPDLGG